MKTAFDITRALTLQVCSALIGALMMSGGVACGESDALTEYSGSGRTIDNVVRTNTTQNTQGYGDTTASGSSLTDGTTWSDPSQTATYEEPFGNATTSTGSTTANPTTSTAPLPTVTSENPEDYFDFQVTLSATRCDLGGGGWTSQDAAAIGAAMGIEAEQGFYIRCILPPGTTGIQVIVDGDNIGLMMRPLLDEMLGDERPIGQPLEVAGGYSYEWFDTDLSQGALTHIDLTLRSYDAVRAVAITAIRPDGPGG